MMAAVAVDEKLPPAFPLFPLFLRLSQLPVIEREFNFFGLIELGFFPLPHILSEVHFTNPPWSAPFSFGRLLLRTMGVAVMPLARLRRKG